MSKNIFHYISLFLFAVATFGVSSCIDRNGSHGYQNVDGVIWHTSWHVIYEGNPSLRDSILPVLDNTGKSLSVFDSHSMVSKVNSSLRTKVDKHFATVYEESKRIHLMTNGEFDPTLSPLITAWGFGKGHKVNADTCRIDSILNFVGFNKTRLENGILIKDDIRTEFNFSAIAKGYGCDMVAEMFKRNGVKNFLIEIGGEIVASGVSPKKQPWRVGIETPSADATSERQAQSAVVLDNMGMATSGNYRNYHLTEEGKKFAHTISARTGRPVMTDVLSATVIAPTCMEADALATAFMAMGSRRAMALADSIDYPVYLILDNEKILMTPKMKKALSE